MISGDFNFDLMKDSDELTIDFCALMSSFGYENYITKPTRVMNTLKSSTGENKLCYSLIDHVWSNIVPSSQYIMVDSPSDHYWLSTKFSCKWSLKI